MYLNKRASRRDHVALYLCPAYKQTSPKIADHEIAEAGFFSINQLPPETTRATRERLAEVFEGADINAIW
jgi:hypothetical protein